MRVISAVMCAVLLASVLAAGCATVKEHEKTAIGAGAGAAGGAVLGGLIGRSTTAVVVGGLLGGLAGGAVGYYLERQDRTAAQASADTGYTAAQGNVIRVDRVQVEPSTVRPGGSVNLAATYTILTPQPTQAQTIRETREVRHNGAIVANPGTEVSRAAGTFTSAVPITLPATAPRGTYEVTTTVTLGDRASRGTTTFTVN